MNTFISESLVVSPPPSRERAPYACHNGADKVLIRLWLTLLYSTIREMDMDGGNEKAQGGNGWMDV